MVPRELLHSALAKQRLDGILTLLALDVLRVETWLRGKGVAAISSSDEDR
eukprot:COSAG05_NODE_16274_length_349_cov_1.502232_1_plen_50_part_00